MADTGNYGIVWGQRTGELSASGAVIAGIANQRLAIHHIGISSGAEAAIVSVLIQDEDLNTILGPLYVGANDKNLDVTCPGSSVKAPVGKGINCITSAEGNMTVCISAFIVS